MLADKKRNMKAGLRQRMRAAAKSRQCPRCLRKAAVSQKRDGDWLTVWCRYCDYEDGRWLSAAACARLSGRLASQGS